MWLFDKSGFTSVVAFVPSKDFKKTKHREIAEASGKPNDWLLIRARVKADLEKVATFFPDRDIFILKDPSADYAYRALVTRDMWKAYLSAQVDEIDYDSHFKEVVRDNAPKHPKRYSSMMSVWSALAGMQDVPPYGHHYGTERTTTAYSGSSWVGKPTNWSTPNTVVEDEKESEEDWGSVTIEDMRKALSEVDNDPYAVPSETVHLADDEAWELWTQAFDRAQSTPSHEVTEEDIEEIVANIEADVIEDSDIEDTLTLPESEEYIEPAPQA